MNIQAASLLKNDEIEALLAARFEDVFSILGMHEHPSGTGLIVRALLPGASAIEVIASKDNEQVASLQLISDEGSF